MADIDPVEQLFKSHFYTHRKSVLIKSAMSCGALDRSKNKVCGKRGGVLAVAEVRGNSPALSRLNVKQLSDQYVCGFGGRDVAAQLHDHLALSIKHPLLVILSSKLVFYHFQQTFFGLFGIFLAF